jgi:Pyridoxamine 5'-phosphate oxidase
MDLDELQDRTFANATAVTKEAYPPERRLRGQDLLDYLDRRAFAVVCSTRSDGRPHAAIVSYLRRGTTFWLPTVGGSVRERNVHHQPWLVLVVSEGDRDGHVAVIVEGSATAVALASVPEDVASVTPDAWVSKWLRLEAQRLISYAARSPLDEAGDVVVRDDQ